MPISRRYRRLVKDLFFICSLALAVFILKSGLLHQLISSFFPLAIFSAFLAGLFFTTFLTAAVGAAAFVVLAPLYPPLQIALIGALGAMTGDLILVRLFRRTPLKEFPLVGLAAQVIRGIFAFYHIDLNALRNFEKRRLVKLIFFLHSHFFRSWILPFIGALVISSPLPDEIGLAILGLSHISYLKIAVISYFFNCLGILAIVLITRAV